MSRGIWALRWTTSVLWAVHGVWVLAHQIERFLVGEGLVGLAELGAAILITRGTRACDVMAMCVSLVSGLLSVIFLTKAPIDLDTYSMMALVSLGAAFFTITVTVFAVLRPGSLGSPRSH